MLTGITTVETVHGNPGESRILPAGLKVGLVLVDNLPVESTIKYWAQPLPGHPWPPETVQWSESVGVGLHYDDVTVERTRKPRPFRPEH